MGPIKDFRRLWSRESENSENFIILRLLRKYPMLLGIEQFGNCEKPVVKNRQRVDGHLPTSAAAIHPRLRHFGDNDYDL